MEKSAGQLERSHIRKTWHSRTWVNSRQNSSHEIILKALIRHHFRMILMGSRKWPRVARWAVAEKKPIVACGHSYGRLVIRHTCFKSV